MSSIILIDLSAIFWRYWHISESDEISKAKRMTVQLVEQLVREHDYCAVCTDAPPYIRSEIYPEYKAGREHKPGAVQELKNAIKELGAIGIPYYGAKGYEADDIIYTLAKQANEQGLDVYISATDKDLLQIPGAKITEPFERKILTPEEKFGCPAEMVADVLALSGDTADNVPGLPLIGPKKAIQILDVIESVNTFLSWPKEQQEKSCNLLSPAIAKALSENINNLKMSKKLVELYDAPVTLKLTEAKKQVEQQSSLPEHEEKETEEKETPVTPTVVHVAPKNEVMIKADGRNANWALALEPENINSAWVLAKNLHTSRMFGQFPNPEAILSIVLRGRSLGMDATTALSNFHVIEGKPTMHASLIVGLVLNSGKAEYFELSETSDKIATWITKRKTGKNEVKLSYTIDEAKQAGLLRASRSGKPSNWETRPKTMLRWRAATELARAIYPDITTGLYTPEEIEESVITE